MKAPGLPSLVGLALLPLAACASAPPTPPAASTRAAVTITVDPGMEAQRAHLSALVDRAVVDAAACLADLGFEVDRDAILTEATFFADAESTRRQVAERFGVPPGSVPPTFGGTVDGAHLLATSPATYEAGFRALFGDAAWHEDEYLRLLVHEVVHRVHAMVATRLFGTEDGMGPRWFFEGLAIDCSGQFETQTAAPSADWAGLDDVIARADADALTPPIYPQYATLFRTLATRLDLAWMIRSAGRDDFVEHLEARWTARP